MDWLQLPIFSQCWGRGLNPGETLKDHPHSTSTPNCSLQEPPAFPLTGGNCGVPCQCVRSWVHLGLNGEAPLDGSLPARAVTKGAASPAIPSELWCHGHIGPETGGLAHFLKQATLTNIIKLPGFNFQPLPSCLFKSVESQTHSFFPPFTGDWSSLMIVLWGGERDTDQEQLESDEQEEL